MEPENTSTLATPNTPIENIREAMGTAYRSYSRLPNGANYNALMLAMRQYQAAYGDQFKAGE